MSPVIGGAAIWALCALWAYGRMLGEVQHYLASRGRLDALEAAVWSVFGPLAVIASFIECRSGQGLRFWPKPRP